MGVDTEKLKLEKKDNLGYFFRLTRKEEKLIRDKKAFMVIETRKDGVRCIVLRSDVKSKDIGQAIPFLTQVACGTTASFFSLLLHRFANKELRHLSNEYNALAEEYNDKQSELKKKTLEVVTTYLPVFEDCANTIAEMDVLISFACVAADAPQMYTRPEIQPAGAGLIVTQGRHPMVCIPFLTSIDAFDKLVRTASCAALPHHIVFSPNRSLFVFFEPLVGACEG